VFGRICLRNESGKAPREEMRVILTTMGRRMRPMNVFGISYRFAVSSIDATTKQNSRFSHR
jgi:hypothetical protein